MNNTEKYEALKLDRQLCFPLYAVSKEIIRKYKPRVPDIMESIFDIGYLTFDLIAAVLFFAWR